MVYAHGCLRLAACLLFVLPARQKKPQGAEQLIDRGRGVLMQVYAQITVARRPKQPGRNLVFPAGLAKGVEALLCGTENDC